MVVSSSCIRAPSRFRPVEPVSGTVLKGVRIDYCQEHSKMCRPDDSFSDEGWKTLFEYDESVRSLYRRENRPEGSSRKWMPEPFNAAVHMI